MLKIFFQNVLFLQLTEKKPMYAFHLLIFYEQFSTSQYIYDTKLTPRSGRKGMWELQ